MTNNIDDKVLLHERVRFRRVGEDGVVVCMHTGKVLVINPVGVHIVDQLSQEKSIDQIIESICNKFDVNNDVASKDLAIYVDQLIQNEVVLPNIHKSLK